MITIATISNSDALNFLNIDRVLFEKNFPVIFNFLYADIQKHTACYFYNYYRTPHF